MDSGPSLWDYLSERWSIGAGRHGVGARRGRIALPEEEEEDLFSLHTSASVSSLVSTASAPPAADSELSAGQARASPTVAQQKQTGCIHGLLTCITAQYRGTPERRSTSILSRPLDAAPVTSPPSAQAHMHVKSFNKSEPDQRRRKSKSGKRKNSIAAAAADQDHRQQIQQPTQTESLWREDAEEAAAAQEQDLWLTSVVVDPSAYARSSHSHTDPSQDSTHGLADDAAAEYMLHKTPSSRSHSRHGSRSSPLSSGSGSRNTSQSHTSSGGSGRQSRSRSRDSVGTAQTSTSVHQPHLWKLDHDALFDHVEEVGEAHPLA